jgi:hypothetical protein
MKFSDIVKQAVSLLHESQRITYRALKREFDLDSVRRWYLCAVRCTEQRMRITRNGHCMRRCA